VTILRALVAAVGLCIVLTTAVGCVPDGCADPWDAIPCQGGVLPPTR
jgi:hypothetical protein